MIKKPDTTVLHTIRSKVMEKLAKLKASASISTTLKINTDNVVYLKNHPNFRTFCAPCMSSI